MTVTEGYSLSPQQKRFWRLKDRQQVARAAVLLRLEGKAEDLRKTLSALVLRHEALRCSLTLPPMQKMPVVVESETADYFWSEAPAGSNEQELLEQEVCGTNCEESQGLRATLIGRDSSRFLLLSVPSAFCDAASLRILVRDLGTVYRDQLTGAEADEEDQPVDYTQYTEWLNSLLQAEDQSAKAWWSDQLLALAPPVRLASDSGKDGNAFVPSRFQLTPGSGLIQGLRNLAQAQNCSTETVWLACWVLAQARLCGVQELSPVVAFQGRSFEELEDSVGLFTRYLPFNLKLSGLSNMVGLIAELERLRQEIADSVDWFGLSEDPTPLEDYYAFDYHSFPETVASLDLTLHLVDISHHEHPFALRLSVRESTRSTLVFSYDPSRLKAEAVEALGDCLLELAASVAANPTAGLYALPMLPRDQRRALLESFNEVGAFSDYVSIPDRIAANARNFPDQTALVYESHQEEVAPSWRQLNERANALAHMLSGRGLGPGDVVALFFKRSADMIMALTAVLKSGATYLPLDPSTPTARSTAILKEAGARLVLTHQELSSGSEVPEYAIDRFENTGHLADPDRVIEAASLAYLIFTSGSTGMPKGVAVTHGNIAGYTRAVSQRLALQDCRHFALVSTLSADLGNTVIFPALANGGTLHVLDQDYIEQPPRLAGYFRARQIDCLKITPSHLEALMAGEHPQQMLPDRVLILGGEATRPNLLERLNQLKPDLRIFNHYGPSETTVGVLTHSWNPAEGTQLPLGTPLTGSRIYLLNRAGLPEPKGAPAEICIGGAGVSRGYLGRPGQTAVRFVPDAFGGAAGMRLYRTGDLGRFIEGRLFFCGRTDHQLKIRGFRVELGEVEAALRGLDMVQDAVVKAWDANRLAAWVIPQDKEIDEQQLRQLLGQRLPDYMIPASVTQLSKFPLNANGKVDRKALPAPIEKVKAEFIQPQTEDQKLMARLWAEMLKCDRPIGLRDTFFDLGGHSLLIFQLIGAIQREFSVALTVRDIFRYNTIETLLERMAEGSDGILVPMNEEGEGTPWFIVHPIGGQVHWYRHLAEKLKGIAPVYALQSPGLVDPSKLSSDIGVIAENYIEAIREVRPEGPYRIAGWSAGGSIAMEIARRLDAAHENVEKVVLIDARNAPGLEDDELEINTLLDFVTELTGRGASGNREWGRELKDMEAHRRISFLVEKLSAAGQIPQGIDTTYFERKFQVYLANARAANGYVPEPYRGQIFLARARDTVRQLMTAGKMNRYDASLGWRKHALANFRAYDIEGNHQTIFTQQHVDALAAIFIEDDPTRHPKVNRALVGRIWLDQATGKSKVDHTLAAVVGIFESNFHDRICGYYLTGSFGTDKATATSDIDLFILFRGHMTAEEYQRAHQTGQNLGILSEIPLDLKYSDESEIKRLGLIDFTTARKIYGEGLSFRPKPPRSEIVKRYGMHMNPMGMMRLRKNPAFLRYPLELPNKDQGFYGYTVVKKMGEEGTRGQTKAMVNVALKLAASLVNLKHGIVCFQKSEVIKLYREKIGGPFAEFLEELVKRCRDEWEYNVPTMPWARKRLDGFCKRMLEFENHFLEAYRSFLLEEIRNDRDDQLWLSTNELRDYLSIPEHRLEEEVKAGRVEISEVDGERLIHLPNLYRLLAITALARFAFLDEEVQTTLRNLLDEDKVFQPKLLDSTLRQLDKARIRKN